MVLARSALRLDPRADRARLLLAQALESRGETQLALAALDGIDPASPFAAIARAARITVLGDAGDEQQALVAAAQLNAEPGATAADAQRYGDALVALDRYAEAARAYADLVALCQFLPGPASSQIGFALGLMRAGWRGALAAFLAFTLPSALILLVLALTAAKLQGGVAAGFVHGLKLVAVAIVAQAVWGMARSFCPDRARASIAAGAVLLLAVAPGSIGMMLANGPAVLLGENLVKRVSLKATRTAAALLFLVLGLWQLASMLGWL